MCPESLSPYHALLAEALGGSSQVREAVFKRLSLYQVLHSYLPVDDITA